MFHTGSSGYPAVELRQGVEVRRLRGACLESCWKEKAVAKEGAQQPTCYRFQRGRCTPWEERQDADVLGLVWPVALSTCEELQQLGYEVTYAQSTYERIDKPKTTTTRAQSGFSVDLTVKRGACEVWLETMWTDAIGWHVGVCVGRLADAHHMPPD